MLEADSSTHGRKFWLLGRESDVRLAVGDATQECVGLCARERPSNGWAIWRIIPTNTCGRAYWARIES
jgi:hypothetical protein